MATDSRVARTVSLPPSFFRQIETGSDTYGDDGRERELADILRVG